LTQPDETERQPPFESQESPDGKPVFDTKFDE
jgi:hypothetical protein